MAWNDDSWRDEYDAWKLASPDDDYEDPCDHDEFEIDILSGRAYCDRCHHSWYVSDEEIAAEQKLIEDYWKAEDRANRFMWWRDLADKMLQPFRALRWRRKSAAIDDDEIPF